jgi:hypothetical protein
LLLLDPVLWFRGQTLPSALPKLADSEIQDQAMFLLVETIVLAADNLDWVRAGVENFARETVSISSDAN